MRDHNPVVSNTTPLISLGEVGLLHVLNQLYGELWIPQAVFDEYQVGVPTHPQRPHLGSLNWVTVHHVLADPAVPASLDAGEREAITLARVIQARSIFIDEKQGRAVAMTLQLPLAGTMTVLLTAKQHGIILLVQPFIDQMISQGRRISPQLRTQVLMRANE